MHDVRTKAKLWRWSTAKGSWYFLTLNKTLSKKIREHIPVKRGFGSIRVEASINQIQWTSSIFPSKEYGYVLPVKASIRKKTGIQEGDFVTLDMQFI